MGKRGCRRISTLSIISAALIWPLDAWLDTALFEQSHSLFEALFLPTPEQLWTRSLTILLLLMLTLACKEVIASAGHPVARAGGAKPIRHVSGNQRYVEENSKLRSLAYRDYLTGLYNRRRIEELLDAMYKTEQLKHGGLALLFCDIDHFKRVNSRYGHPSGDEVLVKLAGLFRQHFRRGDVLGRWGGEEFMIVLSNLNQNKTGEIAEALRKRVEAETFPHVGTLTISIGIAVLQAGEDVDSFVGRADRALRQAKRAGRNRWHLCGGETELPREQGRDFHSA